MRHSVHIDEPDLDEPDGPLMFCSYCDCDVHAVRVDEGIGAYEYWGSKGVHHDWRWHCPTCDEDLG